MSCKDDLEAHLRANSVPYELHHHALAFTAQELAAAEHLPGKMVVKVVMAIADETLIMLAVPAPARVDLPKAASAAGAKQARLAREEEFGARFSDCDLGAMPPFGNLYGVPVYVDRALTEDETIACAAGTHTDTILVKYADFARIVKPTVCDLTQRVP